MRYNGTGNMVGYPAKQQILPSEYRKEKLSMIITQKKPIEEVMAMVGDAKTVAIVGCGSCATAYQTGGEPQIAELTAILEQAGKTVVATTIAD